MTEFFRPYEGRKPYLFVSYSHRNSEQVLDVIRIIHDRRYRLWYDEGIPAGSDWPRNIAVHMRDCRAVLFFLSRTALASPNCLSEITTAKKQGKPILLMKLEDIDLQGEDEKWRACLKGAEEISAAGDARARAERILASPQITEEFHGTEEDFRTGGGTAGASAVKAKIAIILAALLLVLSAAGAWGIATEKIKIFITPVPPPTAPPTLTPRPTEAPTPEPTEEPTPEPTAEPTEEPTPEPTEVPTPEPTEEPTPEPTEAPTAVIPDGAKEWFTKIAEFPDATLEKAIRKALGAGDDEEIPLERLLEITELNIVGNNTYRSEQLKGLEIAEDGTVLMNSIPIKAGTVQNLELMPYMAYLKTLSLIGQPLTAVNGLSGLTLLQNLNLTGSKVQTLEGLENLPSLMNMNLSRTQVKDLTPLANLPMLNRVTVSVDMLPLTLDPEARYDVIVTK